jgi:hypothetical protein
MQDTLANDQILTNNPNVCSSQDCISELRIVIPDALQGHIKDSSYEFIVIQSLACQHTLPS